MSLTVIGLVAGFLTAACWLPQLRKSWHTRSTLDISWIYLCALTTGVGLWFTYGVLTADVPLALANGATGAALVTLICFKFRFDRERLSGHDVAAVLLDMDGTLVDSDAAVERAWTRWAVEYGMDQDVVEPLMHGGTSHTTVRALAPHWDEAAIQEAGDRQLALQYDDLNDVVPARGAVELLRYLDEHHVPWAVVTSADRKLATRRLHAAGIKPPLLVTVQDVIKGKPHPEGYRLAANRLGVDIERCLVVEDSSTGVRAGRSAGARVAGLRGTPADVAIADLGDVTQLLAARA